MNKPDTTGVAVDEAFDGFEFIIAGVVEDDADDEDVVA